jgi:hypothetical protein
MNALMNGVVVPADQARRQQVEWMKERGIEKPRVRIGQYYVPEQRTHIDAEAEAIQSALLSGGPTWTTK